MPSYNALGVG